MSTHSECVRSRGISMDANRETHIIFCTNDRQKKIIWETQQWNDRLSSFWVCVFFFFCLSFVRSFVAIAIVVVEVIRFRRNAMRDVYLFDVTIIISPSLSLLLFCLMTRVRPWFRIRMGNDRGCRGCCCVRCTMAIREYFCKSASHRSHSAM